MSNPCVILAITDVATWEAVFGGGKRIPMDTRSTTLQPSREVADEEAKRLAKAHPGCHYAVFEAQALAKVVEVPSHVSLTGKVLCTQRAPMLLSIGDAGVPF